jgi:hypothetical protein
MVRLSDTGLSIRTPHVLDPPEVAVRTTLNEQPAKSLFGIVQNSRILHHAEKADVTGASRIIAPTVAAHLSPSRNGNYAKRRRSIVPSRRHFAVFPSTLRVWMFSNNETVVIPRKGSLNRVATVDASCRQRNQGAGL